MAIQNSDRREALEVDLHGYHPNDIDDLSVIIEQAWEMGATRVRLIHGHGRNRGISPGFVNTNTGYWASPSEVPYGLTKNCGAGSSIRRWIAAMMDRPVLS